VGKRKRAEASTTAISHPIYSKRLRVPAMWRRSPLSTVLPDPMAPYPPACSPSSANLGERIDGYDRIPDAAPSTRA
jgi:hypothetical protein